MSARRTASADGHPFVRKTAEFLARHQMVAGNRAVCVAVSGGADSMALLHVLAALASGFGLRLSVAHVNHGLRGQESDADEALVREEAERLGLPVQILRIPPGTAPATGLEEWARAQRLAYFQTLLAEGHCQRVATGHTLRDQAETVLFRLLRGAGPDGLAGIAPVSPLGLIRPLLWATREEVMEFVEAGGIPWREDASNADPQFARNRIRNDWLPALREAWNPRLDQALATAAEIAHEENRYLDGIADEEIARHFSESVYGWEAAADKLNGLPEAIVRRVVRRLARRISGASLEFAHVERIRDLLQPHAGEGTEPRLGKRGGLFAAQGVLAERSGTQFRMTQGNRHPYAQKRPEPVLAIKAPGRFPLPGGGEELVVAGLPSAPERLNGFNRLDSGYTEGWSFLRLPGQECVLRLRLWHPGETFQTFGSSRPKKLKELFQRRGVPRWRRADAVVLEWQGQLLWCRYLGASSAWQCAPEGVTAEAGTDSGSLDGGIAVRCEAMTAGQDCCRRAEFAENNWGFRNPAEWESSSGSATS